jgi:hypothetical protein
MDCFYEACKNQVYRCSFCRKSILNMGMHWKTIRHEIKMQPMPKGYFEVKEGDTVITKYGKCDIVTIEENRIHGELVDWKLKDGVCAKITMDKREMEKWVKVYCNDCEAQSTTRFHFLGLECVNCRGFNTTAV